MGKRVKLFWEANNFPIKVILNYLKFSTKSEKIFDFFIPLLMTGGILLFIFYKDPSTSTVLKGVKDINNQSLTFISILAGFNIASISVIATSNSKLFAELKLKYSKKVEGKSLYEVMLTFFSAAIVTQFFIILVGIVILVISSIVNFPNNFNMYCYHWIFISIWIYSLITAVFVSLRNLKTLFYILVYEEY
ncbi:hypothetical protein [Geobacillus sp. 47C-IIb]|uniref:hypothetical protein n=1 Tax=Geobacillus sp. 47C-IIb TaxID=1963026 RepID=UPI001CC1FF63|nr:hypothetical protein [Geobacillus sp. 47C-IIb]